MVSTRLVWLDSMLLRAWHPFIALLPVTHPAEVPFSTNLLRDGGIVACTQGLAGVLLLLALFRSLTPSVRPHAERGPEGGPRA